MSTLQVGDIVRRVATAEWMRGSIGVVTAVVNDAVHINWIVRLGKQGECTRWNPKYFEKIARCEE